MPSVVLDEIGTSRGYANFSIRGLGINSSIPSIDPAVGIIVDGVYLGTNSGVVFDNFDIQSIEVLRGPQGTLFGRNVTGGAVLLNTKVPTRGIRVQCARQLRVSRRRRRQQHPQGSVSGGLTDTLSAKLAVYYNDDQGALVNELRRSGSRCLRADDHPSGRRLAPDDTFELIARYEYQDVEADGASRSRTPTATVCPGNRTTRPRQL
jgi:iron complex outermembrane receptor protein